MARKGKGAALYELLYKDKKATASGGALKLPSWFRFKNPQNASQAQMSGPGTAAPATTPATVATSSSSPDPSVQPAAPAPSPGPAAPSGAMPGLPFAAKPVSPGSPPPITPPPGAAAPSASSAAKPAVAVSRPAVASAPRPGPASSPTGVPLPWLRVADGRFQLNVSTFAAVIVGGLIVVLLLASFIMGANSQRLTKPAGEPGVRDAGDPRKVPVDPNIDPMRHAGTGTTSAGTGTTTDGTGTASGTRAGDAEAGTGTASTDPRALVSGKWYVMVQSFPASSDQAAAQAGGLADYLKGKGFDVIAQATNRGQYYVVRTGVGLEESAAKKLVEPLSTELVNYYNGKGMRIDLNNPDLRPRATKSR